jgi:hypothetical protein
MLSGRRVYAFACETCLPQTSLLFQTFAERTVSACVSVFAGHQACVMAPQKEHGAALSRLDDALFQLIEAFVDGEEDQSTLCAIGERHAPWDLNVELDLAPEDPGCEGAFGWSTAIFLRQLFESLRVHKKPEGLRAP